MTKKQKLQRSYGWILDSNDSDDDEGFDTIMRHIRYEMESKTEKYEKIPEQTLDVLGDWNSDLDKALKSSSSSELLSGSDEV